MADEILKGKVGNQKDSSRITEDPLDDEIFETIPSHRTPGAAFVLLLIPAVLALIFAHSLEAQLSD